MAWKLIDVDCEGFEARFVFYDLFDGGRVDLINAVGVWGDVYQLYTMIVSQVLFKLLYAIVGVGPIYLSRKAFRAVRSKSYYSA